MTADRSAVVRNGDATLTICTRLRLDRLDCDLGVVRRELAEIVSVAGQNHSSTGIDRCRYDDSIECGARVRSAQQTSPAQSPSTTAATEPTSPDEQLPIRGVKYATATTAVGVVELYDSPDTAEQCFTLALADGSDLADCFPNESVHDGTAYVYLRMRPEEPGLLIGLTDPDSSVRVEIGDTSTEPDDHGIWVAEVPNGTDTFIVDTDNGPQTFRIQEPG